jgi:hypothetical protein
MNSTGLEQLHRGMTTSLCGLHGEFLDFSVYRECLRPIMEVRLKPYIVGVKSPLQDRQQNVVVERVEGATEIE